MKTLVRRSVEILSALVLSNSTLADPSPIPEGKEVVKTYVKIEAPGTISEAVEKEILGLFKKLKGVSLVTDSDKADHIYTFEINELRTRPDHLTGYAIVFIWTWRKGVRIIEERYLEQSEAREEFERLFSGKSIFMSDEFYVCEPDGLKERLDSLVSRIDDHIFEHIRHP